VLEEGVPRICLFVAFAALAGAPACGPGGNLVPPTDSCATPSPGSVDAVELGAATTDDLAGHPSLFAPLHDGDGMSLIHGSQGASMLGFILRVTGSAAPACLGQQTTITDTTGARVTSTSTPLATYAQPDGSRLTRGVWLPADYPTSFVVATSATGQSVSLHLHLQLAK
jgi:hypothetical protein